MSRNTLFLLLAMLHLPSVAIATETYDFITGVIEGLQSVQIQMKQLDGNDATNSRKYIKSLVAYNNGIKKASQLMKPYVSSSNEIINEYAKVFYGIYSAIVQNNEYLIQIFLNAPNNLENTASQKKLFLKQIEGNMDQNKEMRRLIFHATLSLIEKDRTKKEKLLLSTITEEEKKSLTKLLVNVFGVDVKNCLQIGQPPVEGSAILLHTFLSGSCRPGGIK